MNHYLLTNHNKFNKSQAQVLENVIEMPKDEVLLIQGPVSIIIFISLLFKHLVDESNLCIDLYSLVLVRPIQSLELSL